MSNIEAISWYDKNLLIFFRGNVGPLHKIQGYQGHRNVIKYSPHHNGDIYTTRGNNFSYKSQNVKNIYFWLFRGPLGGLQWSDWPYLTFQLSSHPYPCTCQIRKQSDKNFLLSLNPKYEKNIYIFFIFGGPGGPYVEPRWKKLSGQ